MKLFSVSKIKEKLYKQSGNFKVTPWDAPLFRHLKECFVNVQLQSETKDSEEEQSGYGTAPCNPVTRELESGSWPA